MVNGQLGWSKVMRVDQQLLGSNGGHFDTFEAIIRNYMQVQHICRYPKLEDCNL